MSRRNSSFICQSCGAVYQRWQGKCEACEGWNTIAEELGTAASAAPIASGGARLKKGRLFALEPLDRHRDGCATPSLRASRSWIGSRAAASSKVPSILLGVSRGSENRRFSIQALLRLWPARARARFISQARKAPGRFGCGRATPWARRCAGGTRGGNLGRGYPDDPRQGAAPKLVIIDSIQTMVDRGGRGRARNGDAGSRGGARADPVREGKRRGDHSRVWHVDEGRSDRGAARCRAYGRCRHGFRG